MRVSAAEMCGGDPAEVFRGPPGVLTFRAATEGRSFF
jgi:hypothetical protein